MSYTKAEKVLPMSLLLQIQEYIDGEYIYIPKVADNKIPWGTNTSTCSELKARNMRIYDDYLKGKNSENLSRKYFLSIKSIQRIIRQQKQFDDE